MKRVYTMFQRKGGATKTTTAAELVLAAAEAGHRVLAVDADTARALTVRLGFKLYDEPERSTADFLAGADLATCVTPSPTIEGVDVLQAGPALDDLSERYLTRFIDVLPKCKDYDVAVLDTPGNYGRVVKAALAAADTIVIPMPAEGEPLLMLPQMDAWRAENVTPLRKGRRRQETWYVPTKITRRQLLDQQMLAHLATTYPGRVTPPVRLVPATGTRAFLANQPLSRYAPTADVADDYRAAMAALLAGL